MVMLAIPNVSEGRDHERLSRFSRAIIAGGARLLDRHSDGIHHRSVFTATGTGDDLVAAATGLARATSDIDLTLHDGVHPRLGALDVCPFVPEVDSEMEEAVDLARSTARAIAEDEDLPVYLYGEAASRPEAATLPAIRRGGLTTLIERARSGFPPDMGPVQIDPTRGVVCVGARSTLIAFNVWLRCPPAIAATIAGKVRRLPAVRALGLDMGDDRSQVSMNLISPRMTSVDAAFDAVDAQASDRGLEVLGCEIVGLVPERYLPRAKGKAARKLLHPGRSLESALQDD